MTPKYTAIEDCIIPLLAAQTDLDNPLREPLAQLWAAHQDLVRRIERISRISDGYQSLARGREMSQAERLDKQLRQLEKVVRISDRYQQMMHDSNIALREASTHDSLTGIANRRLLLERLKEESARGKRHPQSFSLAMLDLDYFKRVNDQHGHDVGDRLLSEVARVMEAEVREHDLCGRWGGEEFLIVLPETDLEAAACVVERVCASIRALGIQVDDQLLSVTVSAGIAEHWPADTYATTINRADGALLQAKRAGRDRCERAEQPG
jgi:diguanylate cyclase (GGDEF)-like protein